MADITNESSVDATVRLNVPVGEVVVPVEGLFFTTTDAPATGSFLSLATLPVTALFWACVESWVPNNRNRKDTRT